MAHVTGAYGSGLAQVGSTVPRSLSVSDGNCRASGSIRYLPDKQSSTSLACRDAASYTRQEGTPRSGCQTLTGAHWWLSRTCRYVAPDIRSTQRPVNGFMWVRVPEEACVL